VGAFFPGAAGEGISAAIENAFRTMASGPSPTTASLLAFGSLLWSARAYFDTLATVLNRIFPSAAPRSFWGHQLTLWSLIVGVGALFLLSSGVTLALSLAQTLALRVPNLFINRAPMLWDIGGRIAAVALTFAMLTLLYRFTPNRQTPPRRRPILVGALVGTLGWEVAKWGFARFLGNVTRYEVAYGGIAGVVVTMTWIYFSSMIVLAGAQAGATWEELAPGAKKS
jgi:membrane protein